MSYTYRILILLLILVSMQGCKKHSSPENDRYVVLSPELAEIIAALGATDDIVGVTAECTEPRELRDKEIVGNFGAIKMESVLNLNPTLVFTSALEQEAIAHDLRKLGIRVESSYPKSLSELQSEILRIGEIIDRQASARALVSSLEEQITTVKSMAKDLPTPRVYLEIYRDPLMSVADNSLVGELIETAGGDNVFARLERDYARVKAEDVISAMPDIIICYSGDTMQGVTSRKGWSHIPAIQNQMIFFEGDIDPDLIQRAGPRSIMGMIRLHEIYQLWRRRTQ